MPIIIGSGLALKLGTDIYRGVQANKQGKEAKKQLKELTATPAPTYSVVPELQNFYAQAAFEAANPQAFSGAETATFNQNLARNTNTQYANAVNRAGGQSSQFVASLLNANNLNAINQFSAQGENTRRGNRQAAFGRQGQAVSQIQNVNNMNTQAQINRRLMIEQALGGAIAQSRQNVDAMWKSFGDLGGNVAGYAMGGGFGGTDGTDGGGQAVMQPYTSSNYYSGMTPMNYNLGSPSFNPSFKPKVDMFGRPIN